MSEDNDLMNTGDVGRRIGMMVTAELLTELGFTQAGRDKRAVLWHQSDYPAMCVAIGAHIADKQDVPMQPKPEGKPRKEKPAPATKTAADKKASAPAPADDDDEL